MHDPSSLWISHQTSISCHALPKILLAYLTITNVWALSPFTGIVPTHESVLIDSTFKYIVGEIYEIQIT